MDVQKFAVEFTVLMAEALDLPSDALIDLLGKPPDSRLKAMRYLPPSTDNDTKDENQGIGPHKDGVFMTYLLQDGEHNCLEVQNRAGQWIPVPPIPGTLVANIGRLLEIITHGVCTATTHRVILKSKSFFDDQGRPLGPRLSMPLFQYVDPHLMPSELSVDIPPHIRELVPEGTVVSDAETFHSGLFDQSVGDNLFVKCLTSFPRVGERWYPELLQQALEKQAESKRRDQQIKT